MVGNSIENIQITHEEVTQHLLRQMSILQFDLAVARAENEKLKNLINDSVKNNLSKPLSD
jgi:ABC-type iron transport system FetAB permease component